MKPGEVEVIPEITKSGIRVRVQTRTVLACGTRIGSFHFVNNSLSKERERRLLVANPTNGGPIHVESGDGITALGSPVNARPETASLLPTLKQANGPADTRRGQVGRSFRYKQKVIRGPNGLNSPLDSPSPLQPMHRVIFKCA